MGNPAAPAAVRLRRRSTVAPVLRGDCTGLESRARIAQKVHRTRTRRLTTKALRDIVAQIRCSFRKCDGPCARSGEILTKTTTDAGATSDREISISVIRSSAWATSV